MGGGASEPAAGFQLATTRGELQARNVVLALGRLLLAPALGALDGVAMELEDCAFPLLAGLVKTDDPDVAFGDADAALLVGAMPRKAGMERGDLLEANGNRHRARRGRRAMRIRRGASGP